MQSHVRLHSRRTMGRQRTKLSSRPLLSQQPWPHRSHNNRLKSSGSSPRRRKRLNAPPQHAAKLQQDQTRETIGAMQTTVGQPVCGGLLSDETLSRARQGPATLPPRALSRRCQTRNRYTHRLVWLGNTVFDGPDSLPAVFWHFFRAARLSAVGAKCRPIACGATLRRLFCKVYAQSKRAEFAALFEPVGQYGVAIPAGVERMGMIAQIIHEAGGVLIAVDGRNAFNAISRTEVLRRAAEHIPEAYALVAKLYGDAAQPALMYGLDGTAEAVMIPSAQGVQQGDPLGPVLFAL